MNRLIHSAKFWTLILDLVVSLILYFTGKYADPSAFEDVKFVIGAIQPVFIFLIGAIAYEDGKAKASGNYIQGALESVMVEKTHE